MLDTWQILILHNPWSLLLLHSFTDVSFQEITNSTKYPDVFVVPVEAGIRYMQNPLPMQVLENYGKDDRNPFGCQSIEDQTGQYAEHHCGGSQSCKFELDVERETR